MPYCPNRDNEGKDRPYLTTDTDDIKIVTDYTLMSFDTVLNLDCYTFRKLLINAFVSKMRQSKEGQDYLEDCWILTQTEMDVNSMKKLFGKG